MLEKVKVKNVNRMLAILSFILSIVIALLVYITGGTSKVYTNLMYIPIALISSTNGSKIGIFHALLSALMVGPFMPLNTSLNLMQQPINWIVRLFVYISIAFIIGYFSDYNKKNKEYTTNLLTHDLITGFKNIESLKNDASFSDSPKTVIALSVKEYEEILGFFGYNFIHKTILYFSIKLKELLKEYDNIEFYRYDGMGFILIVTQDNSTTKINDIIKILESLNKTTLDVDNIPIYIEINMGITEVEKDVATIEGLRQSLISLRYAIANEIKLGIYDDTLDNYYKNIISIASNFKYALANGNIKAAYQNIYNLETGQIHGSELLARWITDNDMQIYPDNFIPIIEKTELVSELTKFMIDIAVAQAIDSKGEDIVVSLNFSPKDFKEETIEYLIETIKMNNLSPKKLQIEITEEVLLKRNEALCYLELLRNHGISIAIDDFGTGYSSYQSLAELPIDVIKIDKSIIQKVDSNRVSRDLVKSIVDFCKANNITTVAEGVETKEIVDICSDLGIDLLQGYYYHRPALIK